MLKSVCRLLASLLLLVSLSLSLCPAALAYSSDQFYVEDTSQQRCITVQVSAGKDYNGAVRRRDKMLKAGYDSFVYKYNGTYRVMCGKFYAMEDAEAYLASIKANTDRDRAYITNARLTKKAIQRFEDIYWG